MKVAEIIMRNNVPTGCIILLIASSETPDETLQFFVDDRETVKIATASRRNKDVPLYATNHSIFYPGRVGMFTDFANCITAHS